VDGKHFQFLEVTINFAPAQYPCPQVDGPSVDVEGTCFAGLVHQYVWQVDDIICTEAVLDAGQTETIRIQVSFSTFKLVSEQPNLHPASHVAQSPQGQLCRLSYIRAPCELAFCWSFAYQGTAVPPQLTHI
jgi:hypothetical protein